MGSSPLVTFSDTFLAACLRLFRVAGFPNARQLCDPFGELLGELVLLLSTKNPDKQSSFKLGKPNGTF